jgi:hypothetical protein
VAVIVPLLSIAPPEELAELPVKLTPELTVKLDLGSFMIAPPSTAVLLLVKEAWVTVAVA